MAGLFRSLSLLVHGRPDRIVCRNNVAGFDALDELSPVAHMHGKRERLVLHVFGAKLTTSHNSASTSVGRPGRDSFDKEQPPVLAKLLPPYTF